MNIATTYFAGITAKIRETFSSLITGYLNGTSYLLIQLPNNLPLT